MHQDAAADKEPPPRIFLDKSPRIVAYQLKRLTNARLLQVERATDDAKYKPVYEAILTRPGMSTNHREEAVKALAKLKDMDTILVVLEAMENNAATLNRRVMLQLGQLVLANRPEKLKARVGEFKGAALASNSAVTRATGFAALIATGEVASALAVAEESEEGKTGSAGWRRDDAASQASQPVA